MSDFSQEKIAAQRFLGASIRYPGVFLEHVGTVAPEDFRDDLDRYIFLALRELCTSKTPAEIGVASLGRKASELSEGKLPREDMRDYATELMAKSILSSDVSGFAVDIHESGVRRRVRESAARLEAVASGSADAPTLVEVVEKEYLELTKGVVQGGAVHVSGVMQKVRDMFDRVRNSSDALTGVSP